MLFLHFVESELFSLQLGRALNAAAAEHGQRYDQGGAEAWGLTGASYLGFALCGLSSAQLRDIQYRTREQFGPVILDCKWYDDLKKECLKGQKAIDALLPGPNGTTHLCHITDQLFLEMLDFCREG